MHVQAEVAFEKLVQLAPENGIGVQPRDFVFILDRHQLVEVARDGLGQCSRTKRRLGAAHAIYQPAVTRRVGGILIVREHGFAPDDQLVKRWLCLGFRLRCGACGHRSEIQCRAPSPEEGGAAHRHGGAVEFDGAVHGFPGHRHQALLPGVAEQEEIAGNRVAEQAEGEIRGVDEMRG